MQQDDQQNSTNFFDIIWLKSAVTGWWESSLYKQNLPGVSMGISWHDIVKSDPLEFVRSSIFSVFDKKSIQFLFITVQHFPSHQSKIKISVVKLNKKCSYEDVFIKP